MSRTSFTSTPGQVSNNSLRLRQTRRHRLSPAGSPYAIFSSQSLSIVKRPWKLIAVSNSMTRSLGLNVSFNYAFESFPWAIFNSHFVSGFERRAQTHETIIADAATGERQSLHRRSDTAHR
jgi:hypothetical protein